MNFQSFGQTVKGHSRDLDGKSKGKTEQARKVRAKPVGRNQLGVKMQLSLYINGRKGGTIILSGKSINTDFIIQIALLLHSKYMSLEHDTLRALSLY